MPSPFFDPEIFGDIILESFAEELEVKFVPVAGGAAYPLTDAKLDEAFRLIYQGENGIPMEGIQTRLKARTRELPAGPMDNFVRQGDRTWKIVGSEPSGHGLTDLILSET